MLRDPKIKPANPKFCGKFESEVRSGFRARNGELQGSGVWGQVPEGKNQNWNIDPSKIYGVPGPSSQTGNELVERNLELRDIR